MIKILHLFPNLMNLYGEYINVRMLELCLESKGYEVCVHRKNENIININFLDYDFIYMGSGLESNQKIALKILKKHKTEISDFINSNKIFLLTGNSFEIFSKKIVSNGIDYEGLGIFDFIVEEKFSKKIASNVIFKSEIFEKKIVGFINKFTEIFNIKHSLFEVQKGVGDNKNCKKEGIIFKNFFGTHLIGPLFVKNPHILEKISELLIKISKINPNNTLQNIEFNKIRFNKIKFYLENSYCSTLKELE